MADFVNPYAFAPYADPPERKAPNGHSALGPRNYSGALKVVLRARTPLLLGGFGPDNKQVPRRADGRLMIPGSGLLGAVRSVHEAMAGGCLRVIDRHYTPVHRDPANTEVTRNLRLAMVLDVDREGRPLHASLCADGVWISKDLLALTPGQARLPATGDRLVFTGSPRQVGNRDVLTEGEVTHRRRLSGGEDGTWVLLVTDTQARNPEMPVYFAAGRPGDGTATVTDGAWSSYLRRVDGTRDMQQLRQQHKDIDRRRGRRYRLSDEPDPAYVRVFWPPPSDDTAEEGRTPIAARLAVRPYLRVGQPIWVEVTGSGLVRQVIEIRPAQLWRSQGHIPVLDRIGEARPCDDAKCLCWSCRIFGSADVDGQRDEVSAQQAYRGHVRVEDAEVVGEPTLTTWQLAPLATPKPSAGQFYLNKPGIAGMVSSKDEAPAATWGSAADAVGPARGIAGRKFYWRTADPAGGAQPRGRRRCHQSEEMTRTVELVPEGAEFATRVAFDNLRLADLGSLVAALDPRRLWATTEHDADYVISVGGGKPFGFGVVTVTVELVRADSARSRYLGDSLDGPVGEQLLDEAVRAFLAEVPGGVRDRWAALRNLLTLGYVADDLVWYPPGAGKKGEPGYDRGFDFWQQTNGVQLSEERRPLAGLPDPAGTPDQQVLTTPEARTKKAKRARQ